MAGLGWLYPKRNIVYIALLLLHRFAVTHSVEGVIAPDYEDQAIMILMARLSPAILQEGCDFCESFTDMWEWLNERHEKRSSKLNMAH